MKSKSITCCRSTAAQPARGTGSPHAGSPAGSLGISSPGFNTLSRMDVSECFRDFSGLIPISAEPNMRVTDPNSSLNVMVSASTKTPLRSRQIASRNSAAADSHDPCPPRRHAWKNGSASDARPPAPTPRRCPHPEWRVPSSASSIESDRSGEAEELGGGDRLGEVLRRDGHSPAACGSAGPGSCRG